MCRLTRLGIIFVVLVTSVACAIPASSGAYLYAGNRQVVNCGVLWLPIEGANGIFTNSYINADQVISFASGGVGDIFAMLNGDGDIYPDASLDVSFPKPPGWTLENPLAETDPATGLKYPKTSPLYWRVKLNDDENLFQNLSQMNVLYLPAAGTVALKSRQNEALRRFVDNGGVLWIDNAGLLDFNNTFFIQNLSFPTGGSVVAEAVAPYHPALSFPFWLDTYEVNNVAVGGAASLSGCIPGDEFDVLLPLVASGSDSVIAANTYGSGRIIATANYTGRGMFSHAVQDDNLPAMRFAYNVISWSSDWTMPGKNPRHTGNAIDTIAANGVVDYWANGVPTEAPSAPATVDLTPRYPTSAAIYKNIAYYTSGGTVYAMDIIPGEDLDGDGNWDDGVQGLPDGFEDRNQDIVWSAIFGGSLSSPIVVTMPDPTDSTKTVEVVAVCSSAGLHLLEAWPMGGTNVLQTAPEPIGSLYSTGTGSKFPPVYASGWFYCLTEDGHISAVNPTLGTTWSVASSPASSGITCLASGGPSFGFVKNDTTEAVLGMLSWTTQQTGTTPMNDQVCGLPVYVTHDRARVSATDTDRVTLNHAGGNRIAAGPTVDIYWLDPINGPQHIYGPVTDADPNVPGPLGQISITSVWSLYPTTVDVATKRNAAVYVNYTMDYSDPATHEPLPNRTNLQPIPAVASNKIPRILSTSWPSMSSDNMLFVNSILDPDLRTYVGGTVHSIRMDSKFGEASPNSSDWIYYLHSGKDVTNPSGGGTLPLPPVILDPFNAAGVRLDPTDPTVAESVSDLQPLGSPVVAGDKVFVTVCGQNAANNKAVAAILCFRANPEFVIRVTTNEGFDADGHPLRATKRLVNPLTNQPYRVRLWQPDLISSDADSSVDPLKQSVDASSAGGNVLVDRENGTITFRNFDSLKLGFGGLPATPDNGYTFTPSLPVWVFLDDLTVPVDFSTWKPEIEAPPSQGDCVDLSQWNNLLWYYVVPGDREICSTPAVVGDKLYFATSDGYIQSISVATGHTQADRLRDWSVETTSERFVHGALHLTGFETVPAEAGVNNMLAVSNGVVLVPNIMKRDGGAISGPMFAASSLPTLVTDGTRVVELDGAGEIKWSMDSLGIPQNSSSNALRASAPISHPSRAKYTATGDILVANTGGGQVCVADKSGAVKTRTVVDNIGKNGSIRYSYTVFRDPLGLLPAGSPLKLSQPVDAEFWTEVAGVQTVIHCLIADAGNHRIIDLVYRIDNTTGVLISSDPPNDQDPDTDFFYPEVNWVTKTERDYVFESIQLVRDAGIQHVWATVSAVNSRGMALTEISGARGGVLAIPYRQPVGSGWDYTGDNMGVVDTAGALVSRLILGNQVGLRYARLYGDTTVGTLLVCNQAGVSSYNYTGTLLDPNTPAQQLLDRDNLTPNNDYQTWRGVSLIASSVQQIPGEKWLIVNSFVDGNFGGEIFEFNPSRPVGIDWFRSVTQAGSQTTFDIHQPSSAIRVF